MCVALMMASADFMQSDNVIASKAETMVTTIAHLQERYGSIMEYCRVIGLTSQEIMQIRFNLMQARPLLVMILAI